MKKSEFVQKAVKDLATLKRKKVIEVDTYESHVCRNGRKQIYRSWEKRREIN